MDVAEVIRKQICNEILQQPDLVLEDTTPLIEQGHITSLQAVALVMNLEDEFDIEIDPEDVNEETFSSIESIASLVNSQLA